MAELDPEIHHLFDKLTAGMAGLESHFRETDSKCDPGMAAKTDELRLLFLALKKDVEHLKDVLHDRGYDV